MVNLYAILSQLVSTIHFLRYQIMGLILCWRAEKREHLFERYISWSLLFQILRFCCESSFPLFQADRLVFLYYLLIALVPLLLSATSVAQYHRPIISPACKSIPCFVVLGVFLVFSCVCVFFFNFLNSFINIRS